MAPSFDFFQVSPDGYTFHLDGHPVTSLSYPALSFLVYVPFLLMGWSSQLATWLNVAAWALSIVILFACMPAPFKPFAIVLGSASVYVAYAVGGVTDALFVPFLILAAIRWDRYPLEQGLRRLLAPCCLGLALGIKQTPWTLIPFILTGIFLEARRGGIGNRRAAWVVARYTLIAGTVFLIPNVPFVVANSGAWLRGITTPLDSTIVPSGQGLISLAILLGLGGGSLAAYSVTTLVVLLTVWVAYAATYPRIKAWTFLLPVVPFFFGVRSFGSYLVMLLPAGVAAMATMRRQSSSGPLTRNVWALLLCGIVLSLGSISVALAVPPPFDLRISRVHTTGQLATVDRLSVVATNRTNSPLSPGFTVNSGGNLTAFWNRLHGPKVVPAGATRTFELAAPNFFAMPPLTGGFQVVAFTDSPGTVSRTDAYLPTLWHVALIPNAVNKPISIGQTVVLKAQILDRLDQPVHVTGIPVYLGQITYAQDGVYFGSALINASSPGKTPVSMTTDSNGAAAFTIQATVNTADPIYFEANLVNNSLYYPYGYSQIVPIRVAGP
jgi:hypothetical protein